MQFNEIFPRASSTMGRLMISNGAKITFGSFTGLEIRGEVVAAIGGGHIVTLSTVSSNGEVSLAAECTCRARLCEHAYMLAHKFLSHKVLLDDWSSIPVDIRTPLQEFFLQFLDSSAAPAPIKVIPRGGNLYKFALGTSYGGVVLIRAKDEDGNSEFDARNAKIVRTKPFDLPLDFDRAFDQMGCSNPNSPEAFGKHFEEGLRQMLSQGHVLVGAGYAPASLGPAKPLQLEWVEGKNRVQRLEVYTDADQYMAFGCFWYWEPKDGLVGKLEDGLTTSQRRELFLHSELQPHASAGVRERLEKILKRRPELLPQAFPVKQEREVPRLRMIVKMIDVERLTMTRQTRKRPIHLKRASARIEFVYGSHVIKRGNSENPLFVNQRGENCVVWRDLALEEMFYSAIKSAGWFRFHATEPYRVQRGYGKDLIFIGTDFDDNEQYNEELEENLDWLQTQFDDEGWEMVLPPELNEIDPSEVTFEVTTVESGSDWFDLSLGFVVDDKKFALRPLLADIWKLFMKGQLVGKDAIPVRVTMDGGASVVMDGERLQAICQTMAQLFGAPGEWPTELKASYARAGASRALTDASESGLFAWEAPQRLKELQQKLASFEGVVPVVPPKGLNGSLRGYQSSGVAWLQFLREFGFGGVLADDMGLGKTVQTLAHILLEKEAGRLKHPALIVAPTSTLPNWKSEIHNFAPGLKVLVFHGADRQEKFAEISKFDIVVTSYPLLTRDVDQLKKVPFHLAVLDEAQNIKNPAAAVSKAASSLKATHRICLSGTPVENRLDELWSLFNFAMPGFLGSIKNFRASFKTPIEKEGSQEIANALAKVVRPFMLRRTKDLVAKELPPKTEIIERIELGGAQRDLYESVRVAVDKRIRETINVKGFDKSRIEILDALLKLRQVCCDPRLVKLEAARKVEESAKMERLVELLDELFSEGRKVLLFSQFTSMLDLVEIHLKEAGIQWVRISGDTKDRETPVKRFQSGEVPLFLISLKAGGTGLNLTAADTVIHFDPWWNPAAENQATDRAHRMGQKKAVFVYKLVAVGTVEEKILELQTRKAKLAKSVFDGNVDLDAALTADDFKWILGETPQE